MHDKVNLNLHFPNHTEDVIKHDNSLYFQSKEPSKPSTCLEVPRKECKSANKHDILPKHLSNTSGFWIGSGVTTFPQLCLPLLVHHPS